MKRKILIGGLAAASAVLVGITGGAWANSVEVGTVKWGRDYEAALAASKETGKPVLILFQEVPG